MTTLSRAAAAAVLSLSVILLSGASASAPATASPSPVVYDALGDSYASGYGVGPYSACGQSAAAYALHVDGRMHIATDDFVACAGATTASLISGGQLDALDGNTDLVTLSIGGNDIGWSSAVGACLVGTDTQCAGSIALVRGKIENQLPARLDGLYAQIAADAPNAHVLVMGYPELFSPEYGAYLGASTAEQQALNDGADQLNAVIRTAARAHGFQFVDVTQRFAGHGVNADDPWITSPLDPAPLHPNAEGWQAYTAAVTAAYKPGRVRHSAR